MRDSPAARPGSRPVPCALSMPCWAMSRSTAARVEHGVVAPLPGAGARVAHRGLVEADGLVAEAPARRCRPTARAARPRTRPVSSLVARARPVRPGTAPALRCRSRRRPPPRPCGCRRPSCPRCPPAARSTPRSRPPYFLTHSLLLAYPPLATTTARVAISTSSPSWSSTAPTTAPPDFTRPVTGAASRMSTPRAFACVASAFTTASPAPWGTW